MVEKRWAVVACRVIGVLMVLEGILLLFVGVGVGIIGGVVGALAFGVGAGSASNQQIAQGFATIALTLASPFVVAAVLGLGGLFLLMRLQRGVIIAAGVLGIGAQILFHVLCKESLHASDLVPGVLQLAAIAAGFAFVPTRAVAAARA